MVELLRTNDLVLISCIQTLLEEQGVGFFLADQHMSVLEGSAGFLARRFMVPEDEESRARRLLAEAGFGAELRHA